MIMVALLSAKYAMDSVDGIAVDAD